MQAASFLKKHKGLLIAVGVATLFALLSLALIVFHAERGPLQISGKVVATSENTITIVNARGHTTTLVPKPGASTLHTDEFALDTFVQAFGVRTQPGTFEFEYIKAVKNPTTPQR